MYKSKKVAVVVPAYNEQAHISDTLAGIPPYVDAVYVVDDGSTDLTADLARMWCAHDPRVRLLRHERNRGVGRAIMTGYGRCLDDGIDIAAVMAGDNQMEPEWLPAVLEPVAVGEADYAKGTRQTSRVHLRGMSPWRRFGNVTLRWLTVLASGNTSVTDPQHGYAAISRAALEGLDLDAVYGYYGYCNDLIVRLSAQKRRIIEVPMPSMYHDEVSKIRYHKYIPKVSLLLLRLLFWRITGRLLSPREHSTLLSAKITEESRT
jgi:glycosyltransferase involved in cell wall biosynthesis